MITPASCRWMGRLAAVAAVVAAFVGLWRGVELHPDLTNRLRDDAFYEFAWAANVAAGRGPTVSDGVTTSGVQLLWSLVLVPIASIFGPGSLPAIAPWIGFLLHLATVAAWMFATRDRLTGFCVGMCWLGNPLLVRESQNGQETALACLLLTVLWMGRRLSERWFLVLSVLAVTARSDLLAAVVALALWRHGVRTWRWLLAPLLALGLHLGVNLWLGGGFLPDSALPMAWLWHHNHAALAPSLGAWLAQQWWFSRPVLLGGPWALATAMGLGFAVFLVVRPWWPSSLRAAPALGVGCASAWGVYDLATAGWAALLLALFPATRRRPIPRGLGLLLVGVASIVALHWAARWYPRDYYAAPLVVVAAAAIQRFGRWRLLLLLWPLAQIQDFRRVEAEPLGGQQEMQMAGRFLAEVLPVRDRVGCFNSGIVTYLADVGAGALRRGIVNLDGVVDARAFAALRAARLDDWLDEQGLCFLLDNPAQFSSDPRLPHASGLWFGSGFSAVDSLVEVARFDVPGFDQDREGTDSMRLYWRRGCGDAPGRPLASKDLGAGPAGGRYVLWPAGAGEVLETETHDGVRVAIVAPEVPTAVVVLVPADRIGTGRLFVRGGVDPVLTVPKL